MDRALPMDRIPAGGVGRTVKLGFEAHADNGFGGCKPDHFFGSLPGCPAGGTALHFDGRDDIVFDFNGKLGGAEQFAVVAETDLPRKAASRRRGNHQPISRFFSGGHHRNAQLGAEQAEIHGEIRVAQEIQN